MKSCVGYAQSFRISRKEWSTIMAVETKEKEEKKKTAAEPAAEKDGAEKQKNSADSKEQKPQREKKEILDDIEEHDLLDAGRESVPLTPVNARFYRSGGGLISMELKNEDGTVENFERVVILRAFPLTNRDEFIVVRTPESKDVKAEEIGMIRRLSDFDEATATLINEDLDSRYFSPLLSKIYSVKDKFGYTYWDVETTAGRITFILCDIFNSVRLKDDGSVMINDIDGNVYTIVDPAKLDPASFKKIEVYL